MIDYTLQRAFLPEKNRLVDDPYMDEMRQFPVKKASKNNSKKHQQWQQNNLNKKYGFHMGRYILQTEFGMLMHPNTRRLLEKTINDEMVKDLSKSNPFHIGA